MILRVLVTGLSLLASSIATAYEVGSGVAFYSDNEGFDAQKTTAMAMVTDTLGVRYGKVNVQMPSLHEEGNNVTAVIRKIEHKYTVTGDLGIGSVGGKEFFVGDATAAYNFRDGLSVYGGVYGDLVDSEEGIMRGITYTGWNLGVDMYTKYYGATTQVQQTYYSNNNKLQGVFAKFYVTPLDGVSVYVSTRQKTNSKQDLGAFYSPEEYERYNVGLGFRRRLGPVLVSGFAETGKIESDFEDGRGNAWRLSAQSYGLERLTWQLAISEDISDSTNYKYRMISASFTWAL